MTRPETRYVRLCDLWPVPRASSCMGCDLDCCRTSGKRDASGTDDADAGLDANWASARSAALTAMHAAAIIAVRAVECGTRYSGCHCWTRGKLCGMIYYQGCRRGLSRDMS